jgi:hypothetical protein
MDIKKRIFLATNAVVKNTDMSKLNYADTLASLKERSLNTAKHCGNIMKRGSAVK